jgi:hypothetical protein
LNRDRRHSRGPLEIKNGYPTDETVTKLSDAMDFQRAVQAYLWALPLIGMAQWQSERHDKFGAGELIASRAHRSRTFGSRHTNGSNCGSPDQRR